MREVTRTKADSNALFRGGALPADLSKKVVQNFQILGSGANSDRWHLVDSGKQSERPGFKEHWRSGHERSVRGARHEQGLQRWTVRLLLRG